MQTHLESHPTEASLHLRRLDESNCSPYEILFHGVQAFGAILLFLMHPVPVCCVGHKGAVVARPASSRHPWWPIAWRFGGHLVARAMGPTQGSSKNCPIGTLTTKPTTPVANKVEHHSVVATSALAAVAKELPQAKAFCLSPNGSAETRDAASVITTSLQKEYERALSLIWAAFIPWGRFSSKQI